MTEPLSALRADKYLHHVRIYKSRTAATQACDQSHVLIGGQPVKPARDLRVGDVLDISRGDLQLVIRVLALPPKRLGPPQVAAHYENQTPQANFIKAAEARRDREQNAQFSPTPMTKKDMRAIRAWLGRDQD